MRAFKTIFLSVIILCLCSIGVMADENVTTPKEATIIPSMSYIDENGQTQTATDVTQIQTDSPSTLNFGDASTSWYWAGGTNSDSSNNPIQISSLTLGNEKGTINLIVGPNGQADSVAMQIKTSSAWELKEGQILNIYQAGTSWSPSTMQQCFLNLESSSDNTNALTINGGTLNVKSGAFNPIGYNQEGLTISSGSAAISKYGQLQSSVNCYTKETTNVTGLTISGTGTLTNAGYLRVVQNTDEVDFAMIQTTSTGLIIEAGTVQTSSPVPSNLTNGVWIQTYNATNTKVINAYGTATLNLGVFDGLTVSGQNQFNVNTGANLTIPNNFELIFGTEASTGTPDGTLSVQGTLTIEPEAQVTMNANSILQNNGTIEVEQPSPPVNS